MKKITKIGLLAFFMFSVLKVNAQSEKYAAAMQKGLMEISTASDAGKMLQVSNDFERVAKAEKNQWLPYYYAALTQVFNGFMQEDMSGLDPIADRAAFLLNKADSMQKNNSEISCVKSMIATLRMLVNPQQRFMQLASEIEGSLQVAMAQDPTNPRPEYLKGQNLKNTPPAFGGGCDKAMVYFNKSLAKFESFKLENSLAPNWGKEQLISLIEDCK